MRLLRKRIQQCVNRIAYGHYNLPQECKSYLILQQIMLRLLKKARLKENPIYSFHQLLEKALICCNTYFPHEIKICLLLGRKVMTNLYSIFKRRDITLPRKVHLVTSMVYPIVMYECDSWSIQLAEFHRIDAFELWCWRRLLRVPWTARRSNQSILKEISPGCSLEGLMLKLKLQYFGYLM